MRLPSYIILKDIKQDWSDSRYTILQMTLTNGIYRKILPYICLIMTLSFIKNLIWAMANWIS